MKIFGCLQWKHLGNSSKQEEKQEKTEYVRKVRRVLRQIVECMRRQNLPPAEIEPESIERERIDYGPIFL